jgi:hypothetical protein
MQIFLWKVNNSLRTILEYYIIKNATIFLQWGHFLIAGKN